MTALRSFAVWLICLPIRLYRLVGSPWVGRNCRFLPTCSEYALEALQRHGPVRGLALTFRRIGRCRPGGGSGYDPVPPE
ncbi:MAG: membrane protein insertion efficiency factor YidD [Pseudomonadota bacterium]